MKKYIAVIGFGDTFKQFMRNVNEREGDSKFVERLYKRYGSRKTFFRIH
jgi:hypothetical protein